MALTATPAFAQQSTEFNLPNYDNRFITYGFTIGGHTSTLRPKFSQEFVNGTSFVGVENILPSNAFGFSIGFLTNFKAAEYLMVRVMPKVSFYDYTLTYQMAEGFPEHDPILVDFTTVDIPVSLKFRSMRRGNHRMFVTGGVTPIIDVTGKKKKEEGQETGLKLTGDNLTADVGVGADFYFPLFKFSPEIRYSYGVRDVLDDKNTEVGRAFDRLGTHIIAFYLVFN